jgi:hypothetical protein
VLRDLCCKPFIILFVRRRGQMSALISFEMSALLPLVLRRTEWQSIFSEQVGTLNSF